MAEKRPNEVSEQEQDADRLRALQYRQIKAANKEADREYLRDKIQAGTHVYDIETIALMLFSGKEAVQDPVTGTVSMLPLDRDRTMQLKAAADVKGTLLKKVLPDIKAVELTGAGGEELGTDRQMAVLELRNRLRAILVGSSLPEVIEQIPEEIPACLM